MRTLRTNSLREQAAEAIRASIVGGELEPGEIYSATTLAERLGVSATPIREAMLDLASAGLVESVRNRGYRVLTPGEQDLDEISELRLMLEVPAMRKVVERASDAQLAALDAVVDAIESTAADGDLAGFLTADRRFHLTLLALTNNDRLMRLVAQLRDQTRLQGLKPLAEEGQLTASAGEHRGILAALQARDGAAAEQLMRTHLEHTRGLWAGRAEGNGAAPAA